MVKLSLNMKVILKMEKFGMVILKKQNFYSCSVLSL